MTAASIVALTIKSSNRGWFNAICIGITMLRMIALKSIVLSLGWRVANPVAIVIKDIGDARGCCDFIANTFTVVVIDPIIGVVVHRTVLIIHGAVVVIH